MSQHHCIRPWESSTVHAPRADFDVDCACAIQRVPADVTVGYTTHLQQPVLSESLMILANDDRKSVTIFFLIHPADFD